MLSNTTENQVTLTALDDALSRITRPVALTIWMDCDYVAGAILQGWPEKWEKTGWTNARGKPVADAGKWQSVLVKIRLHEVSIRLGGSHEYKNWMMRELKKTESCTGATERSGNV